MNTIKLGSRGEDVKFVQSRLHLIADGVFGPLTEEAVKAFQKEHGIPSDGIVGLSTYAHLVEEKPCQRTSIFTQYKKSSRSIDKLILHCTATEEGKSYDVATIRKWHKAKGWSDIGYHYVVYLDGSIHLGRDVDYVGAHVSGHNSHSIGIVYVGGISNGKSKDTRTTAQKTALVELLKKLRLLYPKASIHGHYEFANKDCPCFKPNQEYKNI